MKTILRLIVKRNKLYAKAEKMKQGNRLDFTRQSINILTKNLKALGY